MNSTRCDGRRLVAALTAAGMALESSREEINALNVFPVPDGDTGTNMALTWQAARAAAAAALEAGEQRAAVLAQRAAEGALLHARGSSGLILSQLLAGVAAALAQTRDLRPGDLPGALRQAAVTARAALRHPVEGTIVSVASATAEGAADYWRRARAAGGEPSWRELLAAATAAARVALARTPQQLAVLAEAGRVDAGGRGFVALLDGVLEFARAGRVVGQARVLERAAQGALPGGATPSRPPHAEMAHGTKYGYCTQFLIRGAGPAVAILRDEAGALGDEAQVVGAAGVVRVHLHTDDPGAALSWAARRGRLDDVRVEDMQAQYERLSAPGAPPQDHGARRAVAAVAEEETAEGGGIYRAERPTPVDGVRVWALVAGTGFARICAELGADALDAGAGSDGDGAMARVLVGHSPMEWQSPPLMGNVTSMRHDPLVSAPHHPPTAAAQTVLWLVCADTGIGADEAGAWARAAQGAASSRDGDGDTQGAAHAMALPTSAHAVAALLALRGGQTVEEALAAVAGAAAQLRWVELAPLAAHTTPPAGAGEPEWPAAPDMAGLAQATAALDRAGARDCEVISLYRSAAVLARGPAEPAGHGPPTWDAQTALLVEAVRSAFPGVQVEVLDGGQRGDGYLVTLE